MKIAYYTTTDFLDSDLPLLREYQRMGHQVMVFIPLAPFNLKGALLDIKRLKEVDDIVPITDYDETHIYSQYLDLDNFYFVNRTTASVRTRAYYRTMQKMCRIISEFNPDVVHSTIPLDTLDLLLLKFRKKLVVTMHDPFQHSGKGGARVNFFRWLTVKTAPRIVLLNKVQQEEFCKKTGVKPSRILINQLSSYNTSLIFKGENTKPDPQAILFFGKISYYKGLEYLCEAMVEVHKDFPEARLVIAGGGKIPFDFTPYEDLEYITLQNRFMFAPELARLLSQSAFAVCPYRDATQSGVVMTAFAMDCPIVASNVGALGEQIEDGKTGLLVPPCDSHALAEAIKKMLANPEETARMRENIRQWKQRPDNDWHEIASRYIEFYNKKP